MQPCNKTFLYILLSIIYLFICALINHYDVISLKPVLSKKPLPDYSNSSVFKQQREPLKTICDGVPHIELPLYYSNNSMFQMGPEPHSIWGLTKNTNCSVVVVENCAGNRSMNWTSTFTFSPADKSSIWEVVMPPVLTNGQRCTLNISMGNLTRTLGVIFGDVWVVVGQSNVVYPLITIKNYQREVSDAAKNHPNFHFFHFGPIARPGPPLNRIMECCTDKVGEKYTHWKTWLDTKQDTNKLLTYSGLGFIFAKVLSEYLTRNGRKNWAVGVIQAGIGGYGMETFADQWAIKQCFAANETEENHSSAYNALIHPIIRNSIKGILWWEGESNAKDGNHRFSCLALNTNRGYERKWSNHGRPIYFGIVGMPALKHPSFPKIFASHATRWKQTSEMGLIPNRFFPRSVFVQTFDFVEVKFDPHPKDKRRVMERLMPKLGRMAYGIGNASWNGPYPRKISAVQGVVKVEYDSSFTFQNTTSKSGFYYCCFHVSTCDDLDFHWTALPKSSVVVNLPTNTINLSIQPVCKNSMLPTWLGHAFTLYPSMKDFDTPLYSDEGFKLPGPVWRCKIKTDGNNVLTGCDWQESETNWTVDKEEYFKMN